ncbi:hypothetical protein ACWESM_18705 [Nocardia sp. NPDC003999]
MMHTFVTVGTGDLRQALTAVRCHASTDKEQPAINRLRLHFGRQHLAVVATDRYTGAVAIVSLWGTEPPGGYTVVAVDLLLDDVAKILNVFKGGEKDRRDTGSTPENLLRLEVLPDRLRITDCSGMIDGRSLQVPRLSATESPLAGVITRIEQLHGARPEHIDEMAVSGDLLVRFREASRTYGSPLLLEGRPGDSLLVRVGESLVGILTARSLLGKAAEHAEDYREGWSARLPGMAFEARLVDEDAGEES